MPSSSTSSYENPLSDRYASKEMLAVFSADHRYRTWRRLWVTLAEVERELAQELKVDPYSDYSPLRAGLKDVAQVTALGSLPVTAGISFITGGAGLAASSASTASNVSGLVYSRTAREVTEIVIKKLTALGVDAAAVKTFAANRFYSPADQIAMAEALEKLGATNVNAFIANSATAGSFDVAKFNRYRAELLVRDSARLGTLKAFVPVAGFVVREGASVIWRRFGGCVVNSD